MVAIKVKWRGSYTVEGTVVVSMACLMIALIVVLGFFCHDRVIMKSTANELAVMTSLWKGRYMSVKTHEVDYEALKKDMDVNVREIENIGYQWLQKRLLYGKIQSVRAISSYFDKRVQIEIVAAFKVWNYEFDYKVQSSCRVFESKDLPRKSVENGDKDE